MIQGKWGLEEKLNDENLSNQKDGDLYGQNLKMLTKMWGKKRRKRRKNWEYNHKHRPRHQMVEY